MADWLSLNNAIGWAHFRLQGGLKRIFLYSAAYMALIGMLILLSIRLDPTMVSQILWGWTHGLLGLQLALVVLYVCAVIHKTIRKDITSQMIESHRLMPISGAQIIAGYIGGTALLPLCLFGITLLIGSVTALASSMSLQNWLLANVIILVFAVCAWVVIALAALMVKVGRPLLIVLFLVLVLSNGVLLVLLPGLMVLNGPFMGSSVFGLIGKSSGPLDSAYLVSFLAQLALAFLCYLAAVRKYRRDDVQAFTPLMGLAIIAFWTVCTVVGLDYWKAFRPSIWPTIRPDKEYQIVASIVVAMLLALIPIAGAARVQSERWRKKLLNDPGPQPKPAYCLAIVLFVSLLILVIPYACSSRRAVTLESMVRTGVIVSAFLLSTIYLLRILYQGAISIKVVLLIWLSAVWLVPLVIGSIGYQVGGRAYANLTETIMAISPFGALMSVWGNWQGSTNLGLGIHCILALIMIVVFYGMQNQIQSRNRAKFAS